MQFKCLNSVTLKHGLVQHCIDGNTTATPHSYRKRQNPTFYKIKTPERIEINVGTVDYVHKICPKSNLVTIRPVVHGFCGNAGNIQMLWLFFENNTVGQTPQPAFTQNDVGSRSTNGSIFKPSSQEHRNSLRGWTGDFPRPLKLPKFGPKFPP